VDEPDLVAEQFAQAVPLDVLRLPALAVLVNFGLVTGRDPTRRELEELGHALHAFLPQVAIVDEQRYEIGEQLEILLREVRIEVAEAALEGLGSDALSLRSRIIAIAAEWVRRCAADVGEPNTLAERLARQAVVDQEEAAGDEPRAS
jgi:hypothetical protein